MARVCEKAKIKRRSFHSLRYTFVTLGVEGGASETLVGSMSGHSTVQMLRHYSRTGLDAKRDLIAGLHERLEAFAKREEGGERESLIKLYAVTEGGELLGEDDPIAQGLAALVADPELLKRILAERGGEG